MPIFSGAPGYPTLAQGHADFVNREEFRIRVFGKLLPGAGADPGFWVGGAETQKVGFLMRDLDSRQIHTIDL